MQVCRAAGYYEHALYVAQAAKEAGWYLDILLEDCAAYDEALTYLQDLPPDQATAALQKYGKVGTHLVTLDQPYEKGPLLLQQKPRACAEHVRGDGVGASQGRLVTPSPPPVKHSLQFVQLFTVFEVLGRSAPFANS